MRFPHRMQQFVIIVGLVWASVAARAGATELDLIAKLTASDGVADDTFGTSVALDRGVVLGAAPFADDNTGAVYVHRYDGVAWVEEQKITLPDGQPSDLFGFRVALDGDVALLAAVGRNGFAGAGYVYRYDGASWVLEQELVTTDVEYLGFAVELQGDVAVLTGFTTDTQLGAAYVYRFDGTSWVEEQMLTASDGTMSDSYGASVAMDGDAIVVGAWSADPLGAAYVYRHDGSAWIEEQKLAPSDSESQFFGTAIDIEDDTVVVGAPGNPLRPGKAYVFEYDGSEWAEEQQLGTLDTDGWGEFGISISLDGSTLLVGASRDGMSTGSAFVYRFDGVSWGDEQKLVADDRAPGDAFGDSISLSGGTALIAAPRDETAQGSVYVFFGVNCLDGTVNAGAGAVTSNLYVNGVLGGETRTVDVGPEDLLLVSLIAPTAGGNGKFVLHANAGTVTPATQTLLPLDIGTTCFPFLMNAGASPVIVANNLGKTGLLGESEFYGAPQADPGRATTHLLYPALSVGTVLTFQAVMIDAGSAGSKAVSTTNAVVVSVVP